MSFSRLTTVSFLALATCLAAPGLAQNRLDAKPITGPIKDAGVYHHATGTWTRPGRGTATFGTDILYNNDANTGYFSTINDEWTFFEEGRIPGDSASSEGNSACYEIDCYQTAYCTNQANPITLSATYYEGYAQCTNALTGGPSSTLTGLTGCFTTTGLPASTTGTQMCWIVTLNFAGTGSEFNLGGDFDNFLDDPFDGGFPTVGLGENQFDDYGIGQELSGHLNDGTTGYILAGDPAGGFGTGPFGGGTKASFGFAPGFGTGLHQQDSFYIVTSPSAPLLGNGCYFFGGYPTNPWAGNWHQDRGDKTPGDPGSGGACNPICTVQPNSVGGGACLRSDSGFGTAAAQFTVTDVPDFPGIMFAGTMDAGNLPFGCGSRCVGGTTVRYMPMTPSGNMLTQTIDMTAISGLDRVQFWYRDPIFGAACGGYNLSNAVVQ